MQPLLSKDNTFASGQTDWEFGTGRHNPRGDTRTIKSMKALPN